MMYGPENTRPVYRLVTILGTKSVSKNNLKKMARVPSVDSSQTPPLKYHIEFELLIKFLIFISIVPQGFRAIPINLNPFYYL